MSLLARASTLELSKASLQKSVRRVATVPTLNAPLLDKAVVPELSYGYGDLEPVFSGKLMELHHGKHHAAYVANYNKFLDEYNTYHAKNCVESMVQIYTQMSFHAGGHVNHSIFWTNLAPVGKGGGGAPKGALAAEIDRKWGSADKFIKTFNAIAAPLQGSGWTWLAYSKERGIHIVNTPNQDMLSSIGLIPILAVDIWEHAYYLAFENRRPDYLREIWKIVNWDNVGMRYDAAVKATQ